MFAKIRKRFTYTNIAMTIALIFAMSGGAYAAGKYVISSTKQISPKVLASLKGKPGTNGAQGPAGPAGPQGPVGAAGAKGETGTAGQNGTPGEKGSQGEKGTAGTNGFNGTNGAKGPAGPEGPTGPTGSPWTPNNELPSGATETGTWGGRPAQSQFAIATINFPVALAAELSATSVHLLPSKPEATGTGNLEEGEHEVNGVAASSGTFGIGAGIEDTTNPGDIPPGTIITNLDTDGFTMSNAATATTTGDSLKAGYPKGCPVGATAEKPAAEAGNLCVYVAENYHNDATVEGPFKPYEGLNKGGAGTAGAYMSIVANSTINIAFGTWAVKAP
jgi:hypothetical protein